MPPKTIRELSGNINIVRRTKAVAPIVIAPIEVVKTKTISSFISELTPSQIFQLDSINIGSADEPNYNEAVITIVNSIKEVGFDETIDFLKTQPDLRSIIFEAPVNRKLQENYLIEVDVLRAKEQAEEGIYQCGKCGGKKTIARRKQVRSADEPETTFITCLSCKKQWREG